jgi:hypothetical protein
VLAYIVVPPLPIRLHQPLFCSKKYEYLPTYQSVAGMRYYALLAAGVHSQSIHPLKKISP